MISKKIPPLIQAKKILDSLGEQPSLSAEKKEEKAINLANFLLEESIRIQTHQEKKTQKELARMMEDSQGKAFTIKMTDECFRSHRSKRIANQLVYLLKEFGIPHYVSWFKQTQLYLFKIFGRSLYVILVPLAKKALRKATSKVILPGDQRELSKHMLERRKQKVRLNLNHLGEAILGEEEAIRRLNIYLNDLKQKDIEYVSIKISTIFSQINVLDWDKTISILSERLRQLYRLARDHTFTHSDGTETVKFVNLDMEEYRDLHITKELFKKVLSEEEFHTFSAGIVLQAYIPDSFNIQQEITHWAIQRRNAGGSPIKIRIVKGANLAMEQVEASLHDWPQAPYKTKQEVDSNYKRMVSYGCIPQHADAVHLGIASHNLFDIAYAMILQEINKVEKEISFEMLEGMADHMRRAVQSMTKDILLYCPVATEKDFQNAIAYLIRRLDENTGAENFLRHSFEIKPDSPSWKEQVALFSRACKEIEKVSNTPRHTQNRFEAPQHLAMHEFFKNDPDTNLALPQNHGWARQIISEWKHKTFASIPLVIGKEEIHLREKENGIDPSSPNVPFYQFSLATSDDIDKALTVAKNQEKQWQETPTEQRCQLIAQVAQKMREKRGDLIGVMMKDGGKTFTEADPEVSEAIDFAEYYLRSMLNFDSLQDITFSAKGTILITPPWNFPVSIPTGGICAALVTGNCVLFKPAPEAVLSGWILVNMFWEAGISKNVLQFINCVDDPVGSKLIQDKRINGVILTGGTPTARLFMKLRPSLHLAAETGGKNAFIITGLADRDLALKDLIQSAFGHSGQKCSAASLAILEAEVYDDPNFHRQLKDAVESLKVGPPWDLGSKIIPLIRPPTEALKRGLTTLEKGEKWLVEPKQDPNNPHLWSPGVKLGVKENSFMHKTELFGPVLALMRAKNVEEAIRFANGTPYGLTSGIHSLDKREQTLWIQKIEAGNCYINRGITGAIVQRQPFGGCKASSFGHGSKAGGPNYVAQFMHKKQKTIPEEKTHISKEIHVLTSALEKIPLSTEELALWYASISSYAYWSEYFSQDHDPSKIVGQDNFFRYRPFQKMLLLIQSKDTPLDVLRVFACAISCKIPLEISYHPSECPLPLEDIIKQKHFLFCFIKEKKEKLLGRLPLKFYDRIRLLSQPSQELLQIAAEEGIYLNQEPVLANGRLELLNYLREISLSIDYHRYGNLGLREGEQRTEIL